MQSLSSFLYTISLSSYPRGGCRDGVADTDKGKKTVWQGGPICLCKKKHTKPRRRTVPTVQSDSWAAPLSLVCGPSFFLSLCSLAVLAAVSASTASQCLSPYMCMTFLLQWKVQNYKLKDLCRSTGAECNRGVSVFRIKPPAAITLTPGLHNTQGMTQWWWEWGMGGQAHDPQQIAPQVIYPGKTAYPVCWHGHL